ncbi:nucleotide exchange factor GrpE [Chroococcidiopsis sp. CCALA 051]|uniref:nucleotide exchange factor GrpE n=1 Tax=Chroococcidiopsis sp. CCALA 051 TaxID=869949 RepID=UPI000D0CF903|nr:nucleotide exchange factor GrpE [Chroococcidiopsis sp. CCALA 051]PSM48122.1 nucleotide exchange factor GrpE [Chroococcidiopsis sp. CCALA 051]
MSDAVQSYILTQDLRDLLAQEISTLKKQNILLQQSVREQKTIAAAVNEELFLELLEVGDTLEVLLDYLANNSTPSSEFIQRLPKSLGAVQCKFLNILKKRQVTTIEIEGTQPDFNLCRVVEREIRTDLADQTITKVVRKGFYLDEKVLRPIEIITSKLE